MSNNYLAKACVGWTLHMGDISIRGSSVSVICTNA